MLTAETGSATVPFEVFCLCSMTESKFSAAKAVLAYAVVKERRYVELYKTACAPRHSLPFLTRLIF